MDTKYEEALERGRQAIKDCGDNEGRKRMIYGIFPELRESEDERIIDAIGIALTGDTAEKALKSRGVILSDALAYLEKQKENPKSADSIPSDCASNAKCEDRSLKHSDSFGTDIRDTPAYWRGRDDAMKQQEQKPECQDTDVVLPNGNWTELDERRRRLGLPPIDYDALASEQKEQKPVEKQDYSGLNDLERVILRGFLCAGVENVPVTIIKETAKDCLAPQKPAEWSEEDEKMLRNVYESLYAYQCDIRAGIMDKNSRELLDDVEKEKQWLKSLRPQPHWKPSEEQPDAYEDAMLEVKEYVDKLYDNASIGLNEYDSGLYNGIAETCMKLRGFIKARISREQPELELTEEVKRYYSENFAYISSDQPTLSILTNIARHFYELGCRHTAVMYDDIEYNRQRAEEAELSEGLEEAAEKAGLEYAPIQEGEALDIEGNFYETDDVNWPSRHSFLTGFKAGAKWDRAKMMEKAVEFECIGKKVKMTIQELINYYIDQECCDVADECGF